MRGRVSTASTLQRLGLRAVGRLGGLRALADPERRRPVEGLLRRGAQAGYSAQVAAGRAFVKIQLLVVARLLLGLSSSQLP